MPLPLPNLDTRRWTDLVDEGRALIPRYAPGWTDHNIHDPGITLLELFAWLIEQEIYRVNRIPETHRRKFLELTGFRPKPPAPARAVLAFSPTAGPPLELPAGLTLASGGAAEESLPYRLTSPVTVTPAAIASVQSFDGVSFADRTRAWQEGVPIPAWGDDPVVEGAPSFYVGLNAAPDPDTVVRLWLAFTDVLSSAAERTRIEEEAAAAEDACIPIGPLTTVECDEGEPGEDEGGADATSSVTAHHSLTTVMEYLDGSEWLPLEGADATRALTLDGPVVFVAPAAWPVAKVGAVKAAHHYLRIRAKPESLIARRCWRRWPSMPRRWSNRLRRGWSSLSGKA